MIAVPRTLRRFLPVASPRTPEPSNALFQRIRWRLTLWYTAILAATLLLLGIALYGEVRTNLLGPVDSGLRNAAQSRAQDWLIFPGRSVSRSSRRRRPPDRLLRSRRQHRRHK